MTELTLALGVLALFVTIVTLAVVRGQLTANTQKSDRIVVAVLDRLTERAASEPFAELLDGTFARPESTSCDDPTRSCPEILGRVLAVRWSTEAGGDGDDIVETVDWVEVRAEVDWNGATFSSVRRVMSPAPNWRADWGSLRVNVLGSEVTTEGTEIYLVDAATGRPAAAAAEVQDGVAWLSAPLDVCGQQSDGCSLALGPYGATSTDEVALDAISALGTLRLHQDRLTDTSALFRPRGDASLLLYATNGAGETAAANRLGSVCVWASFHDGAAAREVAYCNDEQPDRILLDSYRPDPGRSWLRLPLPVAVPLTFSTDDPSGGCTQPAGTVRWDGNAWVDGGTCTSWTWGTPQTLVGASSSTAFEDAEIRLTAGSQRYELNWTTDGGIPAAGGSGLHALWSYPRDADLISLGSTCPGSEPHCRSGASVAPVLTAPRVGDARVSAVPVVSGNADFTLTAIDYGFAAGDGPVSVTVAAADLGGGTLSRLDTVLVDGNPVIVQTGLSVGDTVVVASNGTASAPLRVGSVGSGYRTVTFTLTGEGGARTVTVAFTAENLPARLFNEPARVDQGSEGSLRVRVYDTSGSPAAGVVVQPASVPSGMTVGAATSATDGWAVLPVSVATATAGNRTVTLTTSGAGTTGRINVAARAGSITLAPSVPDPVVVDQGSTTSFEFTVRDLAGDLLPGTAVAVWATAAGGTRTGDVYSTARGCETDTSARCEVTVAATAQAPAGSYQLNVSVHGVTTTLSLRVDPTPLRVGAPLLTLTQGSSSELVVTVLDGSGQPVAGVNVSSTTPVSGLTVGSGTTDSNGVARLGVTASSSVASGLHTITLNGGGADGTASVRIRQKVVRLITSSVVVSQGGVVRTSVTALDASGSPVPGTVLTAVSGDGLVLRAAPAGTDGVAVLSVEAPVSVVPTGYFVSLSVSGDLLEMLPVRVQRGVGSVTASGSLTPGASGQVTIRLFDLDGANIAGRALTVATTNSALQIGTSVAVQPASNDPVSYTTGGDGYVNVPVYLSSAAVNGPIALRVSTGGRTFTVYVQVST